MKGSPSGKGRNLCDKCIGLCLLTVVALIITTVVVDDSVDKVCDSYAEVKETMDFTSGNCTVTLDTVECKLTVTPKSATSKMGDYTSESLPEWCSYSQYIKTVVINYGVSNIGNYSFFNCGSLTDVVFSDNSVVSTIGYSAFSSCSNLKNIELPASLTKISDGAFMNCGSLASIDFPSKLTTIERAAFVYCKSLKELFIPNTITSMGLDVFAGCEGLETVVIEDGVQSINNYQFYDCASLTSITIPSSVKSLGEGTFEDCKSLTSISLGSDVTVIPKHAFVNCEKLATLNIAGSLTFIGEGAFQGCSSLPSFTVQSTVTSLGKSCFEGCSSLSAVTIEEGITVLDNYTFKDCKSLTKMVIPASVTKICDGVFTGCTSLSEIDLGSGLTSIGNNNFNGLKALKTVTIGNKLSNIVVSMFEDCTGLETVVIGNSVTLIDNYAFKNCTSLKSITIPASVETIGYQAFYNCNEMTTVTLNEGLTKIDNEAFSLCAALESISIPNSVVTMCSGNLTSDAKVFYNCTSLKSVTVGTGMKYIPKHAFNGCTSLSEVKILGPVEIIYGYSFMGCSSLETFTIPSTVTTIKYRAFQDCTSLSSITIPDCVDAMENAFGNCSKLKTMTITEGSADFSTNLFKSNLANWKLNGQPNKFESITVESTRINGTAFSYMTTSSAGAGCKLIIPSDNDAYNLKNGNHEYGLYINYGLTPITLYTCSFNGLTFTGTGKVFNYEQKLADADIYWVFGEGMVENYSYPGTLYITAKSGSYVEMGSGENIGWSKHTNDIKYVYMSENIITIAPNAFNGCANFQTFLGLPEKITKIGDNAFNGCKALYNPGEGAMIFENLVTVGDYAFNGCESLGLRVTKVTTSIGAYAFSGSKIVYLEAGCSTIGKNAFNGCGSLEKVLLKGDVTIGEDAFRGCSALSEITLCDTAVISVSAFDGCTGIKTLKITTGSGSPSGSIFDSNNFGSGTWLLYGQSGATITTVVIETSRLTDDNIGVLTGSGKSVDANKIILGEKNNYTCKSKGLLVSGKDCMTDRAGLTFITDGTNFNCTSQTCGDVLLWVYDLEKKTLYVSGTGTEIESAQNENAVKWHKYREEISSVLLPRNIEVIGDYAFCGCSSLTFFDCPETVVKVGNYAMKGCVKLKVGVIMDKLIEVGDSAFYGNTQMSIRSVSSLEKIGDSAFYGTNLKSIVITDSVDMGIKAFNGCDALKSLTIIEGTGTFNESIFTKDYLGKWQLPGMSTYLTKITIDTKRLVSDSDYNYMAIIASDVTAGRTLVLTSNVGNTYDSTESLLYVSGLNVNTDKDGLTFVSDGYHFNCNSQTCGEGLYWVFDKDLGELSITGTGTEMNDYDDSENRAPWLVAGYSITKVTFPSSIQNIGSYAFNGCSALEKLGGRPIMITEVGAYAFNGCSSLTIEGQKLTFINLVKAGDYAFAGCPFLMDIRSTLTSVGAHAFDGCVGLATVKTSASIGEAAFKNCTNLKTAYLIAGASVGKDSFNGCSSLESIEICDSASVGDGSFSGCSSLKTVTVTGGTGTVSSTLFDTDNLGSWKLNGQTTAGDVTKIVVVSKTIPMIAITGSFHEGNQIVLSSSVGESYDAKGLGLYVGGEDEKGPKASMTFTGTDMDGNRQIYNSPTYASDVNVTIVFVTDCETKFPSKVVSFRTADYTFDLSEYMGLEKTGYEFLGWYDQATGGTKYDGVVTLDYSALDYEKKIYAHWSVNSHKVTIVYGNGTDDYEYSCEYGEVISAPTSPTRDGYTFSGWDPALPITMPDKDIVIKAKWTAVEHKVTYYSNYGEEVSKVGITYTCETKWNLAVNEFSRTGYAFIGWSTDRSKVIYGNEQSMENVLTDLNLYACWAPITYYVEFDSCGGTGSMTAQMLTYDKADQYIALNLYSKTGYKFDGWALKEKGTRILTDGGLVKDNLASVQGETVVLYALWAPYQYTVTFVGGEGTTGSVEQQVFEYGKSQTVRSNEGGFEKEGYSFIGWYYAAENRTFTPNKDSSMPSVTFTYESDKNITFEAIWEVNEYTLTLYLYQDEKGEYVTETKSFNYGADVSITVSRTGYTFNGWNQPIPAKMPAENLERYASWKINNHTLTVKYDDATVAYTKNLDCGTKLSIDPLELEGHSFDGWDITIPETMPDYNLTVVAKWKVNEYALTLYLYKNELGEYVTQKITTNYNEKPDYIAPTRIGYNLTGWTDKAGNPVTIPETMPAKDLEYYGKWEEKEFTLTLIYNNGKDPESFQIKYHEVLSIDDPIFENHTFMGWEPAIPTYMPAGNVTYTATWTAVKYGLTIEYNNGQKSETVLYASGETIQGVTPVWEGHIHAGWSQVFPTVMPKENIIISVIWGVEYEDVVVVDIRNGQSFVPILTDGLMELRVAENTSVTVYASEVVGKMTGLTINETSMPTSEVTGKAYDVELTVDVSYMAITLPSSVGNTDVYMFHDEEITGMNVLSSTDKSVTFESLGNGTYIVFLPVEEGLEQAVTMTIVLAVALSLGMFMMVIIGFAAQRKEKD